MNLVCKVNSEIELWADEHNFIVRFKKKGKYNSNKAWYFPNLGMAFNELFNYFVVKGMKESKGKEIKDLKEIIWKVEEKLSGLVSSLKCF